MWPGTNNGKQEAAVQVADYRRRGAGQQCLYTFIVLTSYFKLRQIL
jgi:hypothetical protein